MFKGQCEAAAAADFLQSQDIHADQRRELCGLPVSAVAMGTYLGAMDFSTDHKVTQATVLAAAAGVNCFDSAINDRGQRGEKSLGEGLRRLFLSGKATRQQVFVSTKGGFVPFEGTPEEDYMALFRREYADKGIVAESELVAECHCLHPSYLNDQLEKSRRNLGLETIDLYYLHNPETQLEEVPARVLEERLLEAFRFLEEARVQGRIQFYGLATWDGFRVGTDALDHMDLVKVTEIAQAAAPKGQRHGLRAIQLPLNLAMNESAFAATQRGASAISAAQRLGLSVAVSAPLYQSRLCDSNMPEFLTKHFPDGLTDAQRALLFATSVAGVSSAMTGMKEAAHVAENTALLRMPKLSAEALDGLRTMLRKRR
jgi:aryl-alcohol dehydrogenase-like predicted oxidoreductase